MEMNFKVDPRIMEHVGSSLITSDELAITELIKNSYDAKSKFARLHFFTDFNEVNNSLNQNKMLIPLNNEILSIVSDAITKEELIVLEDIGNGMNYEQLQNGFFTVGTDIKKNSKVKNKNSDERIPLGEKGIGRLSAQRLGKILIVETTSADSDVTYILKINWDDFNRQNTSIEDINIPEFKVNKVRESYTRLWILDSIVYKNVILNDMFSDQLSLINDMRITEQLKTSISFLMSPFEDAKEDFDLKLFRNSEEIKTKFNNEMLQVSNSIHSFELINSQNGLLLKMNMTVEPWYLERIHFSLTPDGYFYGKFQKDHKYYGELLHKYENRFDVTCNITYNEEDLKKYLKSKYEKNISKKTQKNNRSNTIRDLGGIIDETVFQKIERLKDICPITCKVYSFRRDSHTKRIDIPSAVIYKKFENDFKSKEIDTTPLKVFLNACNGIKLYRQNCRIGSLGDKDNDWIQLQQYRTSGQQFYRFDLGNTVGYVKLNDPYQDYVREISSRHDLKENEHSNALKEFVRIVFNDFFYSFSSNANHICKDILFQEGLIPEDTTKEIEDSIKIAQEIVKESKKYLDDFKQKVNSIDKNIELDTEEKVNSVKSAFASLKESSQALNDSVVKSIEQMDKSEEFLSRVKDQEERVKKEAYNNYKLMANGLITEAITHELHSLVNDKNICLGIEENFSNIKAFIIGNKNKSLYNQDFRPMYKRYSNLNSRMNELSQFYSFIEKTFIKRNSLDEFIYQDVHMFLLSLEDRLLSRLKDNKILLDYSSTINMRWRVPDGLLLHVFYNLIDNSIYWIGERRNKALKEKYYDYKGSDFIKIEKKDESTIHVYDSGTGVLDKYQYTLFQPLESGKEKDGRGMGLYIVRNILRTFNANIELLEDRNQFGNRYIFSIYYDN